MASEYWPRRAFHFRRHFSMERWQNKVAVVSGASVGIGSACVKSLVAAGLVVVGLARRHEKVLELKKHLPSQLQKNLHALKCDVTQEQQIEQSFDWIKRNLGGTDILINNAGIIATAELSGRNNSRELEQTVATNLLGTVYCTREAFASMRERNVDGHVVIVNSIAGMQVPNLGPDLPSLNIYPATKFGLRAMNEIYRQEFQRRAKGVRVTNISPGMVDTDILPAQIKAIVSQVTPMLKSEDVAEAVLWALSTPQNVQVHNITIKPLGEKF